MRKNIIDGVCWLSLGMVLAAIGISISTWGFWVVMAIVVVQNLNQSIDQGTEMKTLEQIAKQYKSQTFDGRDLHRLAKFIPEPMLPDFGITLKAEYVGKHVAVEFTKETVLDQLREDVAFGFEKALNQRGISAGLMFEVVSMWNWVLEDGLEDRNEDKGYAQYGLPLFKATAIKYGFKNEIGEDAGNEEKYSSGY